MYPIRDWILRFKTETLRKKIDLPDNWLLVSLNKHNWSECLCMIFKQFCVCVERLKVGKREHNKKPRSIVIGRKFFIIPLHISPSVFFAPLLFVRYYIVFVRRMCIHFVTIDWMRVANPPRPLPRSQVRSRVGFGFSCASLMGYSASNIVNITRPYTGVYRFQDWDELNSGKFYVCFMRTALIYVHTRWIRNVPSYTCVHLESELFVLISRERS
jgi:hypothetical protein